MGKLWRTCLSKIKFRSLEQAERGRLDSETIYHKPFRVYICWFCYEYHLTSQGES